MISSTKLWTTLAKPLWFPLLFQLVTIRISSINSYSTSLLLSTNLVILQCGGEHSPANNKSHQLVTSQTYIALILRALPLQLFFLQQSHDPRSEELLGLAGGSVRKYLFMISVSQFFVVETFSSVKIEHQENSDNAYLVSQSHSETNICDDIFLSPVMCNVLLLFITIKNQSKWSSLMP